MATKLKYFSLALFVLMLSGCFKTELPIYSQSHHKSVSHGSYASTYKVRAKDTLYSIGRRFGVNYKTLARNNHIRSPYTIYAGQRIYLKGVAPRSRTLPVAKHQYKPKRIKKVSKKKYKTHKAKRTTRRSTKASRLRWPVKGVLTSRFGRRGSRMHDGIDIGAKEGTPVHAAAAGEVVYSDHRLSGYGRLIIIRHRHDLFTAYAHNQRNLVRKGDKVKTGDVIARVGHTGRATGPHLHFEVRRGPTPVDPLSYLPRKR
ncbi:MAG: M23 family metallopeptidase [Mariprofundaceae bacterium]|nr:M23 family metallopeptidase [Mariprofundaceae bacterium]